MDPEKTYSPVAGSIKAGTSVVSNSASSTSNVRAKSQYISKIHITMTPIVIQMLFFLCFIVSILKINGRVAGWLQFNTLIRHKKSPMTTWVIIDSIFGPEKKRSLGKLLFL